MDKSKKHKILKSSRRMENQKYPPEGWKIIKMDGNSYIIQKYGNHKIFHKNENSQNISVRKNQNI